MDYSELLVKSPEASIEFTTSDKNIINTTLDLIPPHILAKFYYEGWRFKAFTNWNQVPENTNQNLNGKAYPKELLLYIKSPVVATNITHEIAHVWDMKLGFTNGHYSMKSEKTSELTNIMNEEGNGFDPYYLSEVVEYFAHIFRLFFEKSEALNIRPKSKKYVEESIRTNNSPIIDRLIALEGHKIQDVTYDPLLNKINFKRGLMDKNTTSITLKEAESGGGSTESNFIFDNNVNFTTDIQNFPSGKIVYSYFDGSHNNKYGVWQLITDRFKVGNGNMGTQTRTFHYGEPVPKETKEIRHYETNVNRGWTEWQDVVSGGSGTPGVTPNIQIGTVTSLSPGTKPTVTRTGTNENPVFNFGITKGDTGATGAKGADGVGLDNTIYTTNVSSGILTLTTKRLQKSNIPNNTEIRLPSVSTYTEIHLFFDTTTDLTLILPNCKWQGIPNIKANKSYEIIFTYTDKWLGGVIEYGA